MCNKQVWQAEDIQLQNVSNNHKQLWLIFCRWSYILTLYYHRHCALLINTLCVLKWPCYVSSVARCRVLTTYLSLVTGICLCVAVPWQQCNWCADTYCMAQTSHTHPTTPKRSFLQHTRASPSDRPTVQTPKWEQAAYAIYYRTTQPNNHRKKEECVVCHSHRYSSPYVSCCQSDKKIGSVNIRFSMIIDSSGMFVVPSASLVWFLVVCIHLYFSIFLATIIQEHWFVAGSSHNWPSVQVHYICIAIASHIAYFLSDTDRPRLYILHACCGPSHICIFSVSHVHNDAALADLIHM